MKGKKKIIPKDNKQPWGIGIWYGSWRMRPAGSACAQVQLPVPDLTNKDRCSVTPNGNTVSWAKGMGGSDDVLSRLEYRKMLEL